jgi:hypothetical protein
MFHVKVYCLGLSKTGTTSLHLALTQLGLRSLHNVTRSRELVRCVLQERPLPGWHAGFDAFSDGPLYRAAERLHDLDPSARFLIVRRDLDAWINSRIVHVLYNSVCRQGRWRGINIPAWRREHAAAEAIYARLAGRPRVLELDLAARDGWNKLCPFLNHPIPDAPFPTANSGARRLQQVLDAWRKPP